ncbi:RagB/SusD family nutrient uptake outer membrane protein [Carboxylicivirga linearis]|uniref:RagB/SusD family nutrient uptake outer membrane protein n=1 Tax=Carboxylicivirga linearis TaxID=1628157 RepID=A0ABS5JZM9_9BACT|nr:RagB/SusD family nutrient uptake outer membrane protein [Carboxylicivirga linearis]MBS2100375.1 RagB/SusD family nutrient uptake outer membrane protein [Carboxylicivirga linearis]
MKRARYKAYMHRLINTDLLHMTNGRKHYHMKRLILIYSLLIVLMSGLVSCEKLFDTKPLDSTPAEDILTNENDAQTLLYGMYAYFGSGASYGRSLTTMLDIMTDASLASTGFSNQLGQMFAWKINPGTSEVGDLWSNHYGAIYNATYLINNLHTISGDSVNLDRIKGEAFVGRALMHYNLVRLFAKSYNSSTAANEMGIPYRLDYDDPNPSRNSVGEVYDLIVSDLDKALELLPNNESYDNEVFTLDFANGLMARVLLDMKDYAGVIEHTSQVINNPAFSLTKDQAFTDMWLKDTGSEIIWRVGYRITDANLVAPGYNFFNMNNMESPLLPDYIPSDKWVNLFNSKDIRLSTYVASVTTGYGWNSKLVIKYPTNPDFTSQVVGMNMPKPMRLAEMYLMRAEAYAFSNDDESAIADLDALLENRIENHQGVSIEGDALKSFIIQERQRELMFEGFYWFDLKRMGKGFARIPQDNTSTANDLDIKADDYRWQWPIPTSELNGNPVIKQNEGY